MTAYLDHELLSSIVNRDLSEQELEALRWLRRRSKKRGLTLSPQQSIGVRLAKHRHRNTTPHSDSSLRSHSSKTMACWDSVCKIWGVMGQPSRQLTEIGAESDRRLERRPARPAEVGS